MTARVFVAVACVALALAGCGSAVRADEGGVGADVQVPELRGRVVDNANLLSPGAEAQISSSLGALEAETSDQAVVVTLPSLDGESIEETGLRLGNAWRLGQRELDNGVLLIVAPSERVVRIEVGYGLEGLLTDERAQEIIDERLLPAFRSGEFEAGIRAGVAEIERTLRSERRRPVRRMREAA